MVTTALPSTRVSTRRLAVMASFLLFIAVCASAAYWAMQLFKPPARPVAAAPQTQAAPVNTAAAGSLFGGREGGAAEASNYKLQGLVLASSLAGTSLIMSVDGKPAQAYRANREIAPGVTVKEVHPGYVLLSDNGVPKRLELPAELKPSGDSTGRQDPRVAANASSGASGAATNAVPGRANTPPPRTMPPPSNTPAANASASAMPVQQGQQPQQQVAPGTPVPASQVPGGSVGASGTAGTQASGSGQQAVVVQSAPTAGATTAGATTQPQAEVQAQQQAVQQGQVPSPAQGVVVHGGNQQLPGLAPKR